MGNEKIEHGVLIISREADAYASLLGPIPHQAAFSADEAAQLHRGESILFGEPDLIGEALPGLQGVRWVQSTWAGLVPLLDAAHSGVLVTGVKEVFGAQMAEYALGYMLAHELQIIERLKYQAKHEWFDEDTGNLRGKNLGVMGTGSIGQAIALKAGLMGMSVTGLSRSGEGASPFSKVYAGDRLAEFLAGLDYLVSVLPDTAESTGLLGARAFHILPDHAVLINVGRGNVIHDDALINALENGDIGGAVLDVFNQEPLPENHPFWDTPGLLITGHVAARSYPEDLAAIFLRNYAAYQNEEPLNYLLDPDRGY